MRHSGVLMSRIEDSRRPCVSTRSASFQACSRWWPGYASWATSADQVRGPDREVGVDVDARAAAAIEPVVGGPRLAGHQRDPQVLAVGEAEIGGGLVAEAGDEPLDHARQSIDRHDETCIPGFEPVRQRSVAREELRDASRRRLELLVRVARRRVREAARDVVEVRQGLAGEAAGLCLEGDQLRVEPGPPVGDRRPRSARRSRRAVASSRRRAGERSCSMSTVALRSAGPK